MTKSYNNPCNQDEETKPSDPHYSTLYLITHTILSFFAIYLSWKCGGSKFNALQFAIALLCPHLYIIWALAVHGGCGVFNETVSLNLPKSA